MSTATALVLSPFLRFPKFSNSRLDFRRKLTSFSPYTTHPLSIARIRRVTARDDDVDVSFEKEAAFVDGFSSFASDGLDATLNSLVRFPHLLHLFCKLH